MVRLIRPFDRVTACLLLALIAVLLTPPIVPYEPAWELAASLGYAATAAMILTFRLTPSGRRAVPRSYRFTIHRAAGNAALALVVAHVAVMIVADSFVLDYLGWMMPLHVMAGLGGALALLLAVGTREAFLPLFRNLGGRHLHAWAGIAAAGLTGLHLLSSSTKLINTWRYVLLAALLVTLLVPAILRLARGQEPPSPAVAIRHPPVRATGADLLRLLALLVLLVVLLTAAPGLVLRLQG